jgi:ribosomal-protein-alanine N-acetyltransferase
VTLEVRTDNDSAIRLYARKGFRPGKLLRGYYPDGTDARRMSFRTSCGRPE